MVKESKIDVMLELDMNKILDIHEMMSDLDCSLESLENVFGAGYNYVYGEKEVAWLERYKKARGFGDYFWLIKNGCPSFIVDDLFERMQALCQTPSEWKLLHSLSSEDERGEKILLGWVDACDNVIAKCETKENYIALFKDCPKGFEAKIILRLVEFYLV